VSGWAYYAVGMCQHDRSCHGARFVSSRATVATREFSTVEALDVELAALAADPRRRRCGCCNRPIAVKRFQRRRWNAQTETVEVLDQ
jgi:hypothetical protein